MGLRSVLPAGWRRASGFSYGVVLSRGEVLLVAGQLAVVDGNAEVTSGMSLGDQFALCLRNVLSVVVAAGGLGTDIAALRAFVTDIERFKRSQQEIGRSWREILGPHFPAMTLVEVSSLFDENALVEIEATAIISQVPNP